MILKMPSKKTQINVSYNNHLNSFEYKWLDIYCSDKTKFNLEIIRKEQPNVKMKLKNKN